MADNAVAGGLYRTQASAPPCLEELKEFAKELGITYTDEELEFYKEHIAEALAGPYQLVNDLVAPTLPVKYPRTPGYRPQPGDNKCNAWYWKCDIRGADEGILKGKTVAIKDNVCVAGVPMMNGSKVMEGYVPDVDATVITRILDAGGRIVGKTNCENMCFSGSSWTNNTGPTLNPHDQSRSSGGSSGGSAVAVYNGEADMAIGGDQGGSIRIPASWCGVVGHKPTWGLVPYTGIGSIEITCDHAGPIARTVRDCALLLEAIAGYDGGRDSRQPRDLKIPKYSQLLTRRLDGWKIGFVTEGFDGCEEDVQDVVRRAANYFHEVGATTEEVSITFHKHGQAIWTSICTDGGYQCMINGAGAGYQCKGYYNESLIKQVRAGCQMEAKQLPESLKLLCLFGKYVEKNYGNRFYAKAQNLNMVLTKAYDDALEKFDVLVMPTLPYKAPLLPKQDSTIQDRTKNAFGMLKNTAPFDITGHPALSINAGQSDGLPVGMMIVGKHFQDEKVLQAAFAFEQVRH